MTCDKILQTCVLRRSACSIQEAALEGLTHWGRDKIDAISQKTFSDAFSWMKIYWFRIEFHWSLFSGFPISNMPALVQITAWCRPDNKPLSEPMMIILLRHICLTRPQWVNRSRLAGGPHFNIKTIFPGIGIPFIKIRWIVLRPFYIYNENPYAGKKSSWYPWALYDYRDLMLSQWYQSMAVQLSMKAVLPLAKILATSPSPCHSSNTGPWGCMYVLVN